MNITTPDIESQIRECETRLYAAMLASDIAELDALIADDLLFAGPTSDRRPKRWIWNFIGVAAHGFESLCPRS
ncbi:MAG: hypothetical protein Fur0022_15520 [Anaerolineales bacterium]